MRKLLINCTLICVFTLPAVAQDYTTTQCLSGASFIEQGYGPQERIADLNFCIGVVSGFIEMNLALEISNQKSFFWGCPPGNLTAKTSLEIWHNYVSLQPDRKTRPFLETFMESISDGFPCKKL